MLVLFHAPATTAISTLSLHDALPIFGLHLAPGPSPVAQAPGTEPPHLHQRLRFAHSHFTSGRRLLSAALLIIEDRKSTRLNSSHVKISYAVFCLKKKKNTRLPAHRLL